LQYKNVLVLDVSKMLHGPVAAIQHSRDDSSSGVFCSAKELAEAHGLKQQFCSQQKLKVKRLPSEHAEGKGSTSTDNGTGC
jgi:hypothetical protein